MPEPNEELIAAWKEIAFAQHPEAQQFGELVTGRTRDEVMASAASVAERVQSVAGGSERNPYEQAQGFYGRGSAVGSGSMPAPPGYSDPDVARIRRENAFAERFNNAPRDAYGQRLGISPAETAAYTNSRFLGHVFDAVRYWGTMTRSDGAYRRR